MSQTQVQTSGIANNAVTAAKIPNGAVGNTEIDDGAVSFGKISEGAYRDSSEGIRDSSTSSDTQFATEKAIRNAINGVAGRILNINSGSRETKTTHTVSNWTDTGLQVNITPTSATSKIIIAVVQPIGVGNNGWGSLRIVRNSTAIYEPSDSSTRNTSTLSAGRESDDDVNLANGRVVSYFYIDTPGTTSAITYSTQGRGSKLNSNATVGGNANATSVIYAVEISQ